MRLKSAILILLVAAVSAVAGTVPMQVYFGDIPSAVDITLQYQFPVSPGLQPNFLHLGGWDGVTFQFDPGGYDASNVPLYSASADSTGIFGDTAGGQLNLYFDFPAMGLLINFSVLGAAPCTSGPCAVPDALDTIFNNGDSPFYGGTAHADGTITGQLLYTSSLPFNQVALFFDTLGPNFTVDSVSYDSIAPEPVSFLLIATGLVGLVGFKRLRHRA